MHWGLWDVSFLTPQQTVMVTPCYCQNHSLVPSKEVSVSSKVTLNTFSHIFKRIDGRLMHWLLRVLDSLKKLNLQQPKWPQQTPPTSFLLAFKHWLFLVSRAAPHRSYRQWCSLMLFNSSWTCWVPDVNLNSTEFLKEDAVSVVAYWYPTTALFIMIRFILPLFFDVKICTRLIWELNSKIKDARLLTGSAGTPVVTRLPQSLVHHSELWTWVSSDGDLTAMPVPMW